MTQVDPYLFVSFTFMWAPDYRLSLFFTAEYLQRISRIVSLLLSPGCLEALQTNNIGGIPLREFPLGFNTGGNVNWMCPFLRSDHLLAAIWCFFELICPSIFQKFVDSVVPIGHFSPDHLLQGLYRCTLHVLNIRKQQLLLKWRPACSTQKILSK